VFIREFLSVIEEEFLSFTDVAKGQEFDTVLSVDE
jgi:hypothetical protein